MSDEDSPIYLALIAETGTDPLRDQGHGAFDGLVPAHAAVLDPTLAWVWVDPSESEESPRPWPPSP